MIRILQCPIGNMNVGGIENMLMQIYRNIDRTNINLILQCILKTMCLEKRLNQWVEKSMLFPTSPEHR